MTIKEIAEAIVKEKGITKGVAIVVGLSAVSVGVVWGIAYLGDMSFVEVLTKVLSIFGVG